MLRSVFLRFPLFIRHSPPHRSAATANTTTATVYRLPGRSGAGVRRSRLVGGERARDKRRRKRGYDAAAPTLCGCGGGGGGGRRLAPLAKNRQYFCRAKNGGGGGGGSKTMQTLPPPPLAATPSPRPASTRQLHRPGPGADAFPIGPPETAEPHLPAVAARGVIDVFRPPRVYILLYSYIRNGGGGEHLLSYIRFSVKLFPYSFLPPPAPAPFTTSPRTVAHPCRTNAAANPENIYPYAPNRN